MWFKNLQLYRINLPWRLNAAELHARLVPHAFQPCTSIELRSQGWIPPRDHGDLVHTVNGQMFIRLRTETKLLPPSVINQVTKIRAAEMEEQLGYKPGRKQMRDLKQQVADELLPRAFSEMREIWTWIDPANGWLAVDAGSPSKADEVFKMLLKAIDKLPVESLRSQRSPQSCMTGWLAENESPNGFTVDQDTELRAGGDGKATVRYVRHTLEGDEVQRHIAAGKVCTRIALTWNDKISFVLTDSLAIKKLAPLDVLKETADTDAKDEEERFNGDLVLMTGELNQMLAAVVAALGGIAEASGA